MDDKATLNTKITGFCVFYKNDKPGGIGFIGIPTNIDLTSDVHKVLRQYEHGYEQEQNKRQLLDDFEAQLRALSKESTQEKEKMWTFILGNVHILVKAGRIPDDEYNGIMYLREPA